MTDDPLKSPSNALAIAAGLGGTRTLLDIAAGHRFANLNPLMNITSPTRDLLKTVAAAQGYFRDPGLAGLAAAGSRLTPDISRIVEATRFVNIVRGVSLAGFIRPELRAMSGLSETAAGIVQPFQNLGFTDLEWARRLDLGMRSIPSAWAAEDEMEASAEAFAKLSRLADVTRESRPYADETTIVLLDELGEIIASQEVEETAANREARYDDAGRDVALVAFPPSGYGDVLVAAGFSILFPAPPLPPIDIGRDEPMAFNSTLRDTLTSLEGHLRSFIAERLSDLAGAQWIKRRVPEAVRQRWTALRTEAQASGRPVYPPIYYANFMDLLDVMVSRQNWDQAFGAVFASREGVSHSMSRLYGLRNDVAHGRPTTISDDLVVMTEATFLFRALGLPVEYRLSAGTP